jgi:hypothetical protein
MVIPPLNKLSGLNLSADLLLQWKWILPVLLVPFIVGIVSGIYPALFLSSFQPVKTLKGLVQGGWKKYFVQESIGGNTVRYIDRSDHYNSHCIPATALYATGFSWLQQGSYGCIALLFYY